MFIQGSVYILHVGHHYNLLLFDLLLYYLLPRYVLLVCLLHFKYHYRTFCIPLVYRTLNFLKCTQLYKRFCVPHISFFHPSDSRKSMKILYSCSFKRTTLPPSDGGFSNYNDPPLLGPPPLYTAIWSAGQPITRVTNS